VTASRKRPSLRFEDEQRHPGSMPGGV
jgi:hypothetical protein